MVDLDNEVDDVCEGEVEYEDDDDEYDVPVDDSVDDDVERSAFLFFLL